MFVTDGKSLLIIHRSDKVRSVKNTWSFPSGLHDIGETVHTCAKRELMEEFNLIPLRMAILGECYENIVLDETPSWHWVLFPMVVLVESFADIINNEPEKHDKFEFIPLEDLSRMMREYNFHPSFHRYYEANVLNFVDGLKHISLHSHTRMCPTFVITEEAAA